MKTVILNVAQRSEESFLVFAGQMFRFAQHDNYYLFYKAKPKSKITKQTAKRTLLNGCSSVFAKSYERTGALLVTVIVLWLRPKQNLRLGQGGDLKLEI
jgi:hypothetical protein